MSPSTEGQEPIEKMMSVQEAAKKVGLGIKTIYALCQAQQLAHIKIGRAGSKRPRIYIQESDLREALKQLRVEVHPLHQLSGSESLD